MLLVRKAMQMPSVQHNRRVSKRIERYREYINRQKRMKGRNVIPRGCEYSRQICLIIAATGRMRRRGRGRYVRSITERAILWPWFDDASLIELVK